MNKLHIALLSLILFSYISYANVDYNNAPSLYQLDSRYCKQGGNCNLTSLTSINTTVTTINTTSLTGVTTICDNLGNCYSLAELNTSSSGGNTLQTVTDAGDTTTHDLKANSLANNVHDGDNLIDSPTLIVYDYYGEPPLNPVSRIAVALQANQLGDYKLSLSPYMVDGETCPTINLGEPNTASLSCAWNDVNINGNYYKNGNQLAESHLVHDMGYINSSNVAYTNQTNNFTQPQIFSAGLNTSSINVKAPDGKAFVSTIATGDYPIVQIGSNTNIGQIARGNLSSGRLAIGKVYEEHVGYNNMLDMVGGQSFRKRVADEYVYLMNVWDNATNGGNLMNYIVSNSGTNLNSFIFGQRVDAGFISFAIDDPAGTAQTVLQMRGDLASDSYSYFGIPLEMRKQIRITGNMSVPTNSEIKFATNASILWNGTDLIFNTTKLGEGKAVFSNNLLVKNNITTNTLFAHNISGYSPLGVLTEMSLYDNNISGVNQLESDSVNIGHLTPPSRNLSSRLNR